VNRGSNVDFIEKKINLLGGSYPRSAIFFLNFRFISSLIIFFMVLLLTSFGIVLALVISYSYYKILTYYTFDYYIKLRKEKLETEAVYFFSVLTLAIDSNKSMIHSIDLTASAIHCELSNEFKKALIEIKLGKSFTESLNDMKKRIPSDAINNAITLINSSYTLGNSIKEGLYKEIDYLNDKVTYNLKEQILKIPTKISIISVIIFIPLMFLLVFSPIIIEYFK